MLGRLLSTSHVVRSSQEESAPVRQLRARLCAPDAGALDEALVSAAAREQNAAALVALVHERLVELARPELVRLADALDAQNAAAAATLRTMAAQSDRLQPGPRRLGDMLVAAWKSRGACADDGGARRLGWLKKTRSPHDELVAQALKHRPLGDMVFAGCRVPPIGMRIAIDAPGAATTMRLYRSLLLFPNLLANISLVAFHARTGHLGAALIGASLQHGDAAWRLCLTDLLDATPDPELVLALLPHGDMLRTLTGRNVRWIDWLVTLRPMWQAACEPGRAALREHVETMGLQPALARAACVAAASCGLGGANIAVLLGELPVAERASVIESLLHALELRRQLHASGAFEATWQAQHTLACLGFAMTLPETAATTYRELRGAHRGAHDAQPEVVLWLTCLSCACDDATETTLLRLLDMGAHRLETLEKVHPQLRDRLLERLGDVVHESPLVNAFADTTTRAMVAAGPRRSSAQSRMAQACVKHLGEALVGAQPARRAQRMFAGLSTVHADDLREAVCEEPEALLWPLYTASFENRHVLRSGLPLVDDAVAPPGLARHTYESLNATGLPALAVANATHLALVMQKGDKSMWSSSLKRLDDDAVICAVTGLAMDARPETQRPGHSGWNLPEHLLRSAELAPQLWRIIQSEDGSAGKLTELMPHDTGRVVRLFVEAPTLLRHAIGRLGQQPTRLFEGVVDEDDDDFIDLESVGDFLEEALRRATALTDALVSLPEQLLAQRLTDFPTKLADGLSWSDLPEAQVRRTAQICQWLADLKLQSATPRVVALRRRDASDVMRRRRPVYDALAFADACSTCKRLNESVDLPKTAPTLCLDLGQVHGFGLMPLPRKPGEAFTFGAEGIEAPQNLHSLQDVHAIACERDNIAYPSRWSKCVQALLVDVVGEIARWGRREQVTGQQLQPVIVAALSAYLSGFAELPETTCRVFCERALPWGYLMPYLPERPEDPAVGRALQLVADFAVLSRMT